MRAPKMTLCALVAIAASDALEAKALTQAPPVQPPAQKANDASRVGPPQAITARPTPTLESTEEQAFALPSPVSIPQADRLPAMNALNRRLREQRQPQGQATRPRMAPPAVPAEAAAPGSAAWSGPTESGSEASPVYLTTAAVNLALHLAESGQVERARQMTHLLPLDQRSEVLAKIDAHAQASPQPSVGPTAEVEAEAVAPAPAAYVPPVVEPAAPVEADAWVAPPVEEVAAAPAPQPEVNAADPVAIQEPTPAPERTDTLPVVPSFSLNLPPEISAAAPALFPDATLEPAAAELPALFPEGMPAVSLDLGPIAPEPALNLTPEPTDLAAVPIPVIPPPDQLEVAPESAEMAAVPISVISPPAQADIAPEPTDLAAVPRPIIPSSAQLDLLAPAQLALAPPPAAPSRLTPELPPPPETLAYVIRPPMRNAGSLIFPLASAAPVTSPFGWRTHPISGARRFHAGTDFGAPQGTPVLAAMPGRVTRAEWIGGYGLSVEIEHLNGTVDTFYAHLSRALVQRGDQVEQGTVIGHVGSTGFATGPHLHFEVRRNNGQGWVGVDPMVELANARAEQAAAPTPAEPSATALSNSAAVTPIAVSTAAQPTPEDALAQTPQSEGADQGAEACQSLAASGQWAEALAACDRTLAHQPDAADLWAAKAQILSQLGQHKAALTAANQAVKHQPDSATAWNHRAVVLWHLQRYEEGLSATQKALQIDGDYAQAWFNQGRLLKQLGSNDEALAAYDKVLQLNPELATASLWVNRADVLWQLSRPEEALTDLDKAVQLDPNSAQAQVNRGIVLLQMERFEDAIAAYDQALELAPNASAAWYGRGTALMKLNRVQEAAVAFARVSS